MGPKEFELDASFDSLVSGTSSLDHMKDSFSHGTVNMDGPQQPAMTPTETIVARASQQVSPHYTDLRWNATTTPSSEWPGDY